MTIPIAEAATTDAAPALASKTATRAPAATRAPRTSSRGPQGRSGQPGPQGPPQRTASQQARQIRRKVPTTPAGRTNYQAVILAEFVAAMILTAATPFATGKDKAGLSPYAGKDMVRLVALLMLYLILALMTMGGRGTGRIAAWFGGLILIATGLSEAASIATILNVFGTGVQPPPDTTTTTQQTTTTGPLPQAT